MVFRSVLSVRFASLLMITLIAASFAPNARGQAALPNHLTKRVVADYGYWSKYQLPAYGAAQIPYHKLTHINHAGVSFDASGTLTVPQGFLEPELNNMARAAGVKVLLLLGGDFPGLEAGGLKQTLVDNVAAFEKQYGYDGLDIDWEYPETSGDRFFLAELMAEFRASNPDYVLSIDAAPWGGYGYDLQQLQVLAELRQHHDVRLRGPVDAVWAVEFAHLLGQSRSRAVGMPARWQRVQQRKSVLDVDAGQSTQHGNAFLRLSIPEYQQRITGCVPILHGRRMATAIMPSPQEIMGRTTSL